MWPGGLELDTYELKSLDYFTMYQNLAETEICISCSRNKKERLQPQKTHEQTESTQQ